MNKRLCAIVIALIFIGVADAVTPLSGAIYETAIQGNGNVYGFLTVTQNSDEAVSISCATPQINFQSVEFDGRAFDQLSVPADALTGSPGGPALPAWSRWIELPDGMKPVLHIETADIEVVRDIDIAPFPSSACDNPNVDQLKAYNPEAYRQDELIPTEPASISQPLTIGGKRWTIITLSPYRFNPARRELHITGDLKIQVAFEPDPSAPRLDRPVTPAMRELENYLSGVTPRRDDISRRVDNLGHFVIVTDDNDDLQEALEPFVEWKKRKGFVVTVVDLEETGDDPNEIRNWLVDAYEEWDLPPTFVLLAGDAAGGFAVPTFYDGQADWVSWHVSDNHYVRWNGNAVGAEPQDWIPDGFIGRLPAANTAETERMVAKILSYETDPYVDDPWIEGALLIANGVKSCEHTKVAVRELMEGYGYQRDDIHQAYADWWLGQRPNLNEMLTAINNGVGFINFRGYNPWGEIYQNHILNLENEWMLPIVTGMVCGTNDFANSWPENQVQGGCRGEAFLRAWDGHDAVGAVACFGPTDLYTWTWYNNTMDGGFYDAILVRDVSYLGVACVASKLALLRAYTTNQRLGSGQTVGYYFYTYTLLGDPTMQVRTREPEEMEANFPRQLPAGATFIDVDVRNEDDEPIEGAYVHVYLSDDVRYGAFTDNDGSAQLVVDPLEEGNYQITITCQNFIPVMDEIEVAGLAIYLSLDEMLINDDEDGDSHGNGDEASNPNETIELTLTLRNTGTDDCDGATAEITTASPWVEIVRGIVEYDAVNAGETADGAQPFVINLASGTPDGEMIDFELTTTYGNEAKDTHFSLPVTGYRYEVVDYLFLDGDLYPGEEQELLLTLRNGGGLDAGELNATLHCDNPKIQIRRAETIFERDDNGFMDNEGLPFQVFAGPNAYQGSEVPFGLLLTDENGLSDSIAFIILLGDQTVECPQGPDGYGYWAFDNRDTETDLVPEYDWIPGTERVGNLADPNDQGHNSNHGSRTFMDLPFEFIYYGEHYEEITIGSNGWLCFGHSDQISWNNQGMGSGLAPAAMLAPFWTDIYTGTVYTRYDEEEARFIVEWRGWSCQQGGGITFEVILYDPTVIATRTGDGEIVFQYNGIPNLVGGRDYPLERATIGICSHNRTDKLQIRHANEWDPRTADLEDEMAVRFSTGAFNELGGVHGNVTDMADGAVLEGARAMIDGTGFFDNSDEDGNFNIQGIPIGEYTVVVCRRHYNDGVAENIQIVEDESQEVNFTLTHPTFDIDIEQINYGLRPDSTGVVDFNVWNEGNGPLDYNIKIDHEAEPPGGRDDPFDIIFDYNLSDTTGDFGIKGVTFDRDYIYVTGIVEARVFPHKIYILDREGELVREINQYAVDSTNSYGYSELTWNGENLLALDKSYIVELTGDGELVDTILSPIRSPSSIVWAKERSTIFLTSITAREITEINSDGEEVATYGVGEQSLRKYGLGWFPADPDGFPLYILVDNNYEELGPRWRLMKLNLETGEIVDVHFFDFDPNDRPIGCVITKHWNPMLWIFIGLVGSPDGDRVFGAELGPNLTWISIDPTVASVPPDETQTISVDFYAADMPERDYYVVLELRHNAVGDRYDIPVYFTIDQRWDIREEVEVPFEFSFDPPHPNPFNPTTHLSFTLAKPSAIEIAFYDITGRLVDEIDLGQMETGCHTATFNGSDLSSGIYLARLKAGSRIVTRKMVLMK